jgi:hypothetical protein
MLHNFLYMLFLRFTIMKYSTERLPLKGKAHYRPGQALRLKDVKASRISRQSIHTSGKVVSRTHRNITRTEGNCDKSVRFITSVIYDVTFDLSQLGNLHT